MTFLEYIYVKNSMKENFKSILESFEEAGIALSNAEFSITEYSLNTSLSFRFENLDELLDFLHINESADNERVEKIHNALVEAGVDADNFFYVNFYSPKIAEL